MRSLYWWKNANMLDDAASANAAFGSRARIARTAGNAVLAAAVASRSVIDDPLTFGVQVARRFPSARKSLVRLAGLANLQDRELLRTWLSGDVVATQETLDGASAMGSLSRISAEVAQAAGRPELVVDDRFAHPGARARAAWQLGEVTQAVEMLGQHAFGSRLHRGLRAELALMTPGTRLRWAPSDIEVGAGRHGVLHLLTNSLPHTHSGYTARSHAILMAQREAGMAPTAITRVGYPVVVGGLGASAVDTVDGIEYHRALPRAMSPTPDGRLVQQADAVAQLTRQLRPSLLQTTTHYPNALVVREVAEAFGLPWAYEVRGMLEQTWVATLASEAARERALASERYRLTRAREAELASGADLVFTLSGSMRDDLTGRGVPVERIHLVPNGIDAGLLEQSPLDPGETRASLGLPREGFWVGAASSLVDYEGFDVLVDAVALARSHGDDVRLLLIGDGAARPSLERRAEAALGGAARFTGRVGREVVGRWRGALDLVVVPRHDRDVTRTVSPLKPIEAMAAGKPLLVSALPPLLETIGDELADLGAAVPPGDPIALAKRIGELARDEAARARLGSLGRSRARARTWQAVGATYRHAIGDVIDDEAM